jgi:hypothetical protein
VAALAVAASFASSTELSFQQTPDLSGSGIPYVEKIAWILYWLVLYLCD